MILLALPVPATLKPQTITAPISCSNIIPIDFSITPRVIVFRWLNELQKKKSRDGEINYSADSWWILNLWSGWVELQRAERSRSQVALNEEKVSSRQQQGSVAWAMKGIDWDERKDLPIRSSVLTLPIKNSLIALFKPIHHHPTSFTVQVFEMIESREGRCKCLLRIKGCSLQVAKSFLISDGNLLLVCLSFRSCSGYSKHCVEARRERFKERDEWN